MIVRHQNFFCIFNYNYFYILMYLNIDFYYYDNTILIFSIVFTNDGNL